MKYETSSQYWDHNPASYGGSYWLHVYASNPTATVVTVGGKLKWKIQISAYIKATAKILVSQWSEPKLASYIHVYFYSDSTRTNVIASKSVKIEGAAMSEAGFTTPILATATTNVYNGTTTVYTRVVADLGGMNGGKGLLYEGRGKYIRFMYCDGVFSELPTLGIAASIKNLENRTPYKNDPSVSQSFEIIRIRVNFNGVTASNPHGNYGSPGPCVIHWTCNGTNYATGLKEDERTGSEIIEFDGDGHGWNHFDVTGLSEFTTYTISAYVINSLNMVSNTASIVVKTRARVPFPKIYYKQSGLESLKFTWNTYDEAVQEGSFAKPIKEAYYRIGETGGWVSIPIDLNNPPTSGEFTVPRLTPNTWYKVYFRCVSTDEFHGLCCPDQNGTNYRAAAGTTYPLPAIRSVDKTIFGEDLKITLTNVQPGIPVDIIIWTEGNGRTGYINRLRKIYMLGQPDISYSYPYNIQVSQQEWDDMYKCFENKNDVPIYFQLMVYGEAGNNTYYTSNKVAANLLLTGIAKTAYIGTDNNVPKRAQVWVKDETNNTWRRAVAWIGISDTNTTPHRTI